MTTDIYNISNAKIICRVLPFFARGRRITLFLEAVALPLVKLHKLFKAWAYKMIVKVRVTSQTMTLIWYLNYVFSHLFKDKSDSFEILQDREGDYMALFNISEWLSQNIFPARIFNAGEEADSSLVKQMAYIGDTISQDGVVIVAPTIDETSTYTKKDYYREVENAVNEYKTTFNKFEIWIGYPSVEPYQKKYVKALLYTYESLFLNVLNSVIYDAEEQAEHLVLKDKPTVTKLLKNIPSIISYSGETLMTGSHNGVIYHTEETSITKKSFILK